MKAVVCTRYGPPEVLRLQDVELPTPKRNEVCIQIYATAVTSSDCYVRGLNLNFAYRLLARLALGLTAPRQPILGMVLAGKVAAVGSEVRLFSEGDEVFGLDRHRFGTYAEYVCWPENSVLALRPLNLTYEESAAIPFGGLLALHGLRRAGVKGGQRVLIYGASGAVGTSAVQLARHFGAGVTGVCSGANVGLVHSLGATSVVDYMTEDFAAKGQLYDVIFDAVGKSKSSKALQASAKALTPGGVCLSVDDGTPKFRTDDLVLLKQLAETGEIRPVVDQCYPLREVIAAHRYVDGGHKKGNVVMTVHSEA